MITSYENVEVLGVPVAAITRPQLFEWMACRIDQGLRSRIMYANAHTLNLAYRSSAFRAALQSADLVYCDGAGVKLGAKLLGQYLPERMTGADWIHRLCEVCQREGYTLYFLGGERHVAAEAARCLSAHYPNLEVVGAHHGYFEHFGEESRGICAEINKQDPDILLVGLGSPLQELWLTRNFAELDVSVGWAVGALMDFVTGRLSRAPLWMRSRGLEWLGRLIVEPVRLSRRYLVGNPLFLWRVLRQRLALSLTGFSE
jgi:N-acetylglucosaminyldiphosphoundecaprenol N-acetyl-beta-D-mannosaminyltransferase